MPGPPRVSLLSFSNSFSSSIATSPTPQSEAPELSPSNDRLKSNLNAATEVSQTPIPSSLALSNLIPAVLLLIYALYIIRRIRQYNPLSGINRFFRTCVFLPRNGKRAWRRKRRGNGEYVHINANINLNDCIEHDEWNRLACGNLDYEEIELENQQHIDMKWERIKHERCKRSYQLIDISSSGSDTASDTASNLLPDYIDEGFDNNHNHNHKYEHMDQDDRHTHGHIRNPPPAQKEFTEFDMSKYFDPKTSRLREHLLLAPGTEIGSGDEDEYERRENGGDITAWIHRSVSRVVARFINWLEG
ncbi:hypothetical protein GX50_00516 [[Emmonsia] crescens]|uniref:Uncharacterized protein n=1 Tax=[Emmonsia] crescens TaxID=73230 RepID=A0A2B7ZJI1_9EURO|nr:hypothetical protein GX50_00516 [Emmonsia crescens]